jgi:hypothetical protein
MMVTPCNARKNQSEADPRLVRIANIYSTKAGTKQARTAAGRTVFGLIARLEPENNNPCAITDRTPAATTKSFLDIWAIRIAQNGFFLNYCNIVDNLSGSTINIFESIDMRSPKCAFL